MKKAIFRTATFTLTLMLAVVLCAPAEYASAQTNSSQPNAAPVQVQQPQDGGVNWPGTGYGVGALFVNLLYVPAKMVYAILGGLVGGGTYLITAGNKQAADTVWRSAWGGDYVVTPQMLAGEQPLNFSGPTSTPPENIPPANTTSASSSGANYGSVAPIAPIPASGSSASNAASTSGQPLDHGAGPANGANIE